jgi:sugar lactone lactonase YvrE
MDGRIFMYDIPTGDITLQHAIRFNYAASIIVDNNLTVYVASAYDKIVYIVPSGSPTIVSQIGIGLPISIALSSPSSLTYDASSNIVFLADYAQDKVYSIDTNSKVTVIAGTGLAGYSGDGAQGNLATLNKPTCVYYSRLRGYVFISDFQNNAIRYVNFHSGPPIQIQSTTTYDKPPYYTTTTIVQTDITFDSLPQTSITENTYSLLANPSSIQNTHTETESIDSFVFYNNTIYFVSAFKLYTYNTQNLVKTQIGGTGQTGYTGDGTTTYKIGTIACMVIRDNILYLCDKDNSVVRTLNLETKIITTFMGGPTQWTADGSTPINTSLKNPTYIGFDNNGIFYISDTGNYCIRRINTTNRVQTAVGTGKLLGTAQYNVNVQSTAISLGYPTGFVFDQNNNLIFCDSGTSMIYIVDKELRMNPLCAATVASSTITASNSTPIRTLITTASSLSVSLDKPYGITKDSTGSLYVTSYNTHQIFKMVQDPGYSTYSISVIVGNNFGGFNPNDMFSRYATINNPSIIQVLPDSSFYFIDASNKMIRYVLSSIYDTYNKGLEGMLPYAPLSIIANNTENTYNTTALTGGEETSAVLNSFTATSMCVDFIGNIYVCNTTRNNILKFDTNGNVTAIVTGLSNPKGISIYNNSVLYISDNGSNTIKFVSINRPSSISTLTGITNPQINAIYNMGYLFTTQPSLNKISVYNIRAGTALADINVVTIASISAAIISQTPYAIALDSTGNLFVSTGDIIQKYAINYTGAIPVVSPPSIFTSGLGICPGITYNNNTLYYISKTSYIIYSKPASDIDGATGTVIAGTQNNNSIAVNGAYANSTTLFNPLSIVFDTNDTMYILDSKITLDSTIYKITPYNFLKKDIAYIITGSQSSGTTVNGAIAYFAKYNTITSSCFGPDGSIYISDTGNNCIWKLDTAGYVSKYVGIQGNGGLTGRALTIQLRQPQGIIMSKDGILYICDTGNNRIVNVTKINGDDIVSLVAGTGTASTAIVNSRIATNTPIQSPSSIIIDNYSNIFVSCTNQIIKINPLGIMNTYIGGGTSAVANGLQPLSIAITPGQLAINSSNELHFINGNQVLKLSSSGTISIVAGNSSGFSPDGTAATSANLSNLQGLAIDSNNNIYISDTENNRVRIISEGVIKTVAGTGAAATSYINTPIVYGSGQIPLQTIIARPGQLAIDSNNRLLITQLQVPQLTLIPFTNTNPCGLVGRYIDIESQGQGVNILNITLYGSTGNVITLSSIVALTNEAASQRLLQPTNNTAYVSATTGFNETVRIDIGSDTIISFVNIKSAVSLGMKFQLLDSQKNVIYESIISPNIANTAGEYIIFRSIYAQTQCTIPANLPATYRGVICGVSNVRYVKIRGNGSTPIKISIAQLAVIADSGVNVALGKPVTAISQANTGPNMVDGYYGSKSLAYESNTGNNEWVKLDLGADTTVVFIFLYLDSNKTSISGLYLDLLDSTNTIIQTRLIKTVPNTPSLQYISFDFRSNNAISSCISFNDIRHIYKLPSGSSYRSNKIRYVRIGTTSMQLGVSQILVKSADDGSNLAYQKPVRPYITNPINMLPVTSLVNNTFSNINSYIVSNTSAYLEVDLGLDYNVSDIIIYTPPIIYGSSTSYTYTLTTYASDGTAVSNPNILNTTSSPSPTTAIYSFNPQYGTQNVKYVSYQGSATLAINELIVIDRNGVNVAYGITPVSNPPYQTVTLKSEYEIILVAIPKNTSSTGIVLLKNSYSANSAPSVTGVAMQLPTFTTNQEVFDFRYMTSPGPFVALRYAKSVLNDPYLINVIRARYIRLENPGLVILDSETPPEFSQLTVYDLFGLSIAIGNPTRCSKTDATTVYNPVSSTATAPFTFSNIPGDLWEVDLGDEYSISSIVLNSTNTNISVTFYNKYREEMRRLLTTTSSTISLSSLPAPQLMPPAPTTRSGACVRFIRIESKNFDNGSPNPTFTHSWYGPIVIRQIVAIDARGINVAVGKATRNSNFGTSSISQSYGAINGRFDSTYRTTATSNEWWEVDLGDNYDIKTVIYYNDIAAPQTTGMKIFFLDSYRYIQDYRDIGAAPFKQTFNFPATAPATPISVIQNYGKKARYVLLNKATSFTVCQVAVIDCLGRNVALGKTASTSPQIINGNLTANKLYYATATNITIDLGEEYYITNVIGYSFPSIDFTGNLNEITGTFNTSLNGTTVVLKDAYNNQTGTKTFGTESCSYNVRRWTDITFGNVPYYCTNNDESLIRNWETGFTAPFGLPTCDACPTTNSTYSGPGYDKCYNKCPTGYNNDLNRGLCVENQSLAETRLKASSAFLNSQITTATTATNGILSMPFYLSNLWNTDKTDFTNKFTNKTVTAVTSSWVTYAADYVINTWNLTIGTVQNALWDTNPFGRPLEVTSQPTNTASTDRVRTTALKRVEENTIIPPGYYNTQYYQFYFNPATSSYDFVDIPMRSFLNSTPGSGWASDKILGATYCESLDFTGYTVPPVPARRARVVTVNPSAVAATVPPSPIYTLSTTPAPYTVPTNCSGPAAIAKSCTTGYTTTYLLQDGGKYPLALYPPNVPDTTNYTPSGYTFIGSFKYSGSGAMGDDNGRFGINTAGLTPTEKPNITNFMYNAVSAVGAFMYNGIPNGVTGSYIYSTLDTITLRQLPAFDSFTSYSPMYIEFSEKSTEGNSLSTFLNAMNTDTDPSCMYNINLASSTGTAIATILVSAKVAYSTYYVAGTGTTTPIANYADSLIGYKGPFVQTVTTYTNPDGTTGTKKLFRINFGDIQSIPLNIGQKYTLSYKRAYYDEYSRLTTILKDGLFNLAQYSRFITARETLLTNINNYMDDTFTKTFNPLTQTDMNNLYNFVNTTWLGNATVGSYSYTYKLAPGKTFNSATYVNNIGTTLPIQATVPQYGSIPEFTIKMSETEAKGRFVAWKLLNKYFNAYNPTDVFGPPGITSVFSNNAIIYKIAYVLNARPITNTGGNQYNLGGNPHQAAFFSSFP